MRWVQGALSRVLLRVTGRQMTLTQGRLECAPPNRRGPSQSP